MLPDSTEITLNAHSSISYLNHWRNDQPGEVRLEGEALFHVKHVNKNINSVKNKERFIVVTQNIEIEVLGTIFDVKNRRGNTEVILKSGQVKIVLPKKKDPAVTMYPGEMIAYEVNTNEVKRSVTDPEIKTAWVDKKLILENASVNTIVQYLEDNYGYKVIVKDTAIGNKKMEGTLMLDNIQDVLFVLSTSLDIKIKKEDSTLIFSW